MNETEFLLDLNLIQTRNTELRKIILKLHYPHLGKIGTTGVKLEHCFSLLNPKIPIGTEQLLKHQFTFNQVEHVIRDNC